LVVQELRYGSDGWLFDGFGNWDDGERTFGAREAIGAREAAEGD
jgi:hypothetical protein